MHTWLRVIGVLHDLEPSVVSGLDFDGGRSAGRVP